MGGSPVSKLWLACAVLICACACACAGALRFELAKLRLFGAPVSYTVETTVLLNDVTKKDKEVGYKIKASLDVAPVWTQQHAQFLLKFRLHSPQLYLRGKHILGDYIPYDSVWDKYRDSTFYALWINGLIEVAYLDPTELPDVLNYKKSLISLFQFQLLEGEHNETDVSGPCLILYETMSDNVFRKIKRRCEYDSSPALISPRRATRYTLSAARDALLGAYGEELLLLGDEQLGLKARVWQRLEPRDPPAARPEPLANLQAALRALPDVLQPLTLLMGDAEPVEVFEENEELGAALRLAGAGLGAGHEEAGGGGDAGAARAALSALPALRAAPPPALAALLAADHEPHYLTGLCRLLGLAGARTTHAAASDFLQLHARDPLHDLAHVYLSAFALGDLPDAWAVLEVLRLGEAGRAESVAESALLAAAAAAARRVAAHAPGAAALAQNVRDALARALARCRDEPCRAVRVAALGNLRREDTAELLLAQATTHGEPRAALAALRALAAAPPRALTFARLDRLGELALDERAALEVRAAALDLVTQRRAELPAPLARLAYRLHERGPHELRRVLWQRLGVLAARHEPAERLPRMLEPHMRAWDAQAHGGSSSVLVRETGWAAGGWRALLESVQLARAGLLRHGTVRLLAQDVANDTLDLLDVEVLTRGLEAFGGGAPESEPEHEPEPEPASGTLQLVVAGARMRDISLFDGQAELLGHVWAGTASSATPALRALRPLGVRRLAAPLAAGVWLHAGWRGALALALDAQAQVSLWYRSARAQLHLRAAAAADTAAQLRTAWGRVSARAHAAAEPRLRIAADLDFYDDVSLCVRVHTDDHDYRRNVTLESQQGARALRVRRERETRVARAGRTLALGRPNDATCRTLRSADAADAA